jgi:hypothetical protein
MALGEIGSNSLGRPASEADLQSIVDDYAAGEAGEGTVSENPHVAEDDGDLYDAFTKPNEAVGDDLVDALFASEAEAGEDDITDEVAELAADATEADAEVGDTTPGAQKRIQQLVSQKNELKEELAGQQAAMQQQLAQMQQQMAQQAAQQNQALQQQLYLAQQQAEAQARMAREEAERQAYEKMTPLEQHQQDTVRRANMEAESRMEQLINQQVGPLRQQLEQAEQARLAAEEKIAAQQRRTRMQTLANSALDEVVYQGFDQEVAQPLKADTEEMLYAYCAAFGEYPNEAAPKFKKFMDNYAKAWVKTRAKVAKKPVQAAKKVPAQPRRQASQGGLDMPSWDELQSKGMDYIDAVDEFYKR